MIRTQDDNFLMYIEPNIQPTTPLDDEIVEIVNEAFKLTKKGTANYSSITEPSRFREGSGWRGSHSTGFTLNEERVTSSNLDYLLPNGMITNSLLVYYLRYHRDEIPEIEMEKVNRLIEYMKSN